MSALDSSAADFDFLIGQWNVRHRRLVRRLAGCTDWQTFGGTSTCWKLMGGQGNVDDDWFDLPGGAYRAATLRAFDPATRRWSIWWLDGRYADRIEPPMVGAFDRRSGVGTFYADELFEQRPIRVRFLWSHIGPAHCRWEQAFSPDGGASWETNWEMDFDRAPLPAT